MADSAPPPPQIWISPTLANKSIARVQGDSLYVHEVIALGHIRNAVDPLLDVMEIAYRDLRRRNAEDNTAPRSAEMIVAAILRTYGRRAAETKENE